MFGGRSISTTSLILLAVFLTSSVDLISCHDKVLLREISALTLQQGRMTSGRRSSPVPQVRCVGGSAKGAFVPKVVQCINQGHDGIDVQWRCDADLPHDVEFGKISVSCEGYSYPEDPYVLRGSCGLEYELDYTYKKSQGSVSSNKTSGTDYITYILVALFISYFIYSLWSGSRNTVPREPRRGGYGGFDGGPGYPGGGGGGPPPSYHDSTGHKPPPYGFKSDFSSSQQGASGSNSGSAAGSGVGGFWTGAALGALGGYFAGNRGSTSETVRNRRFMQDTGFTTSSDAHRPSPSSSDDLRANSGYGGTTRR